MNAVAVLLAVCCVLFGEYKRSELRKRCTTLEDAQRLARDLKVSIEFGKKPLKTYINECVKQSRFTGVFLFEMLCETHVGRSVMPPARTVTSKQDALLFSEFISKLGTGGPAQEDERLNLFCKRLDAHIAEAQNEYAQKGRLCRTLGYLGALTALILFFEVRI